MDYLLRDCLLCTVVASQGTCSKWAYAKDDYEQREKSKVERHGNHHNHLQPWRRASRSDSRFCSGYKTGGLKVDASGFGPKPFTVTINSNGLFSQILFEATRAGVCVSCWFNQSLTMVWIQK